jgi:hypothetical protein
VQRAIRRIHGVWIPVMVIVAGMAASPARAQTDGDGSGPGVEQRKQPVPVRRTAANKVPDRPHSFDVSLDAQWIGPSSLGSSPATMTPNQLNPTTPFTYFSTDARMQSAPGFEGRIGYALNRTLSVEGGFAYRRPNLAITASADSEQAPTTVATERVSEYLFDAAVLVHLRGGAFGRQHRAVPFAEAGAAYLRQAHAGSLLIDTGQVYYGGGGLKYFFSRRAGAISSLGLRVDARVCYRRNGYTVSSTDRPVFGVVTGGLLVTF